MNTQNTQDNQPSSHPDAARSRLRTLVSRIDREVTALPKQKTGDGEDALKTLLASWGDLVDALALGPEPDIRECPVCKHIGMRDATICGYCWTSLKPLP